MIAWKTVPLGEVAAVFNGKTPSKAEQRFEGHPVLKIKDVNELGKYRGKFESFVEPELAKKLADKHVRDGDTLILNAAHSAGYVASKTYLAQPPTFGALATGEWLIIRPQVQTLDASFVHHWVNSSHIRHKLRELVNGIHLYPKDVVRLRIPLPPLAEQRRITEVLDRAEALRVKRRAALAQLAALTQAIFIDMFCDPATNSKGIRKEALGEVIKLKSGEFLPATEMAETGTFPVFGGNGINGYHDQYMFEDRQIIIGRVGVYCGCVHVSPPRSWVTDNALYVSERKTDLEFSYLAYALTYADLNQYASQSGQPLVSGSRIYPVEILVPPLSLQHEFARRVSAAEKLKAAHCASLAEMDALFAVLQHRAFKGEL